jgi:hypothetical protein
MVKTGGRKMKRQWLLVVSVALVLFISAAAAGCQTSNPGSKVPAGVPATETQPVDYSQWAKELRQALDFGERVKSGQVYLDENIDLTEYFKSLAAISQREKELREALDLGERIRSRQVYLDENIDLTEYFRSLVDIQAKYGLLRQ